MVQSFKANVKQQNLVSTHPEQGRWDTSSFPFQTSPANMEINSFMNSPSMYVVFLRALDIIGFDIQRILHNSNPTRYFLGSKLCLNLSNFKVGSDSRLLNAFGCLATWKKLFIAPHSFLSFDLILTSVSLPIVAMTTGSASPATLLCREGRSLPNFLFSRRMLGWKQENETTMTLTW